MNAILSSVCNIYQGHSPHLTLWFFIPEPRKKLLIQENVNKKVIFTKLIMIVGINKLIFFWGGRIVICHEKCCRYLLEMTSSAPLEVKKPWDDSCFVSWRHFYQSHDRRRLGRVPLSHFGVTVIIVAEERERSAHDVSGRIWSESQGKWTLVSSCKKPFIKLNDVEELSFAEVV